MRAGGVGDKVNIFRNILLSILMPDIFTKGSTVEAEGEMR